MSEEAAEETGKGNPVRVLPRRNRRLLTIILAPDQLVINLFNTGRAKKGRSSVRVRRSHAREASENLVQDTMRVTPRE